MRRSEARRADDEATALDGTALLTTVQQIADEADKSDSAVRLAQVAVCVSGRVQACA